MEIVNEALQRYAEQYTTPENDVLNRINRETYAKVMMPRMLSGHLQGRVLALISHLVRPERVLEIGTYTGYSAICLAEGLATGGKLFTIDKNEELAVWARKNFEDAGLEAKIEYLVGDATQIIASIRDTFDLVFIDADKENYARYFDLVIDKVRKGGIILADNVLWSGKVLDEKPDKDTRAIIAFNKKVQDDPRVENVLLPIRDGIFVIRKVSL